MPLRNGYITESACAYGKVGNFHGHACATSSSAELKSTWHTNGEMRVKDTGQWQAAQLCKSQRAIESSRELAIRHCWDTTKSIIGCKEPPYADPHVRWCERSENKSRRKTYFCFPPTRFLSWRSSVRSCLNFSTKKNIAEAEDFSFDFYASFRHIFPLFLVR